MGTVQLGGAVTVYTDAATNDDQRGVHALRQATAPVAWTSRYLRAAATVDFVSALAAGFVAYEIRFDRHGYASAAYLALSALLPVLWIASVALAGGYDQRFIGVGTLAHHSLRCACSAAISGLRRSFSRQRERVGPIAPIGISSAALISS